MIVTIAAIVVIATEKAKCHDLMTPLAESVIVTN